KSQQTLNRAYEADGVVELVHESARAVVCADEERDGAMTVNVVRAVLRVVFDYEDSGVFPVRTVRDGLDDEAERVVIVGDVELRGGAASGDARRVVVRQTHDGE